MKTPHTSTKAARRLTTAVCHWGSTFQPQTMVYCVVPVTPSLSWTPKFECAHK